MLLNNNRNEFRCTRDNIIFSEKGKTFYSLRESNIFFNLYFKFHNNWMDQLIFMQILS